MSRDVGTERKDKILKKETYKETYGPKESSRRKDDRLGVGGGKSIKGL